MSDRRRQQLHELPLELRAYINQQVSTLAPFCLPDSRAAVTVFKEVDDNDLEEYIVTISLINDGTEVKSTSSSDNIFEATRNASATLLEHLQHIHSEMVEASEASDKGENGGEGEGEGGGGKAVCH